MLDAILDVVWEHSIELWITERGYYVVSAPSGHLEQPPELVGVRPDRPIASIWETIRHQSKLLIPAEMPVETAVWIDARNRMWRATYFHSVQPIVVLRRVGFPFTVEDYPAPFRRFIPTLLEAYPGLILLGGPVGGGKSALMSVLLRELTREPVGVGLYEESLEIDLPEDRAIVFHRIRGVHYDHLIEALESDRRVMLRAIAVQEVTERELPVLLQQVRMGRLVMTTMHGISLRELLFRIAQALGGPEVLVDPLIALVMIHLRRGVEGRLVPVPAVFRPVGSVRVSLTRGDIDGAIQAHENDREGYENLPEATVLQWLEAQGWLETSDTFQTGRAYIEATDVVRVIPGRLGVAFRARVQVTKGQVRIIQMRPFRDPEAEAHIVQEARSWGDGFYEVELTE